MHNHSDAGGKQWGIMWMMVPCLFLLGIIFLGGGNLSSGGYIGPVLIGIFVIAHVWMMFKGHGGHNHGSDKNKTS